MSIDLKVLANRSAALLRTRTTPFYASGRKGSMDTATPPERSTPKARRTRTHILDVALRLFAEVGYHTATNAAIAAAPS